LTYVDIRAQTIDCDILLYANAFILANHSGWIYKSSLLLTERCSLNINKESTPQQNVIKEESPKGWV